MAVILYADMRAGYIVNVFQGSDQGTSDKTAHRLPVLFGHSPLTILVITHLTLVVHIIPPDNDQDNGNCIKNDIISVIFAI